MSSSDVVVLRLGEGYVHPGEPERGIGMIQMAVLVLLGELLLRLGETLCLGEGWPNPRRT